MTRRYPQIARITLPWESGQPMGCPALELSEDIRQMQLAFPDIETGRSRWLITRALVLRLSCSAVTRRVSEFVLRNSDLSFLKQRCDQIRLGPQFRQPICHINDRHMMQSHVGHWRHKLGDHRFGRRPTELDTSLYPPPYARIGVPAVTCSRCGYASRVGGGHPPPEAMPA